MDSITSLKVFLSYSHNDNTVEKPFINEFKKHLAPLRDNGLISDWYDGEIIGGEDFQDKIDNNLEEADIFCLFISADYLSSKSCKKEKEKALEIMKRKGVPVIPIILSPCGWLDDPNISKLLALPTDGEPVSKFQNRDVAWKDVYHGLKEVIDKEKTIKTLKIKDSFQDFLQDAEMLTEAHSKKKRVVLSDIFIFQEIDKYDILHNTRETISTKDLIQDILKYKRVVIAGENQSGKTSLCKMMYKGLREKGLLPVFVADKKDRFKGRIDNKIFNAFQKQYQVEENINNIHFDVIMERIIPILDDFHFAKDKERHIKELSKYRGCIVVIDDVFGLNIEDETLIGSFYHFKLKELKPSLRYELIKKWVHLTDNGEAFSENDLYKEIDEKTELINNTLGKIVGKGIMPAYPFFILSALVTHETFSMPLDQEITSQGYCYQALIYFYLRKQGVRNDDIDTYFNFLTEIAFYFYKEKRESLSLQCFDNFMKSYLNKFTLPIEEKELLENLTQIVSKNTIGNYAFQHLYLYYFFVAKYLAEHIEEKHIKDEIDEIKANLHVDKNAYIAIFIAHHSKDIRILDEIILNAMCLFEKFAPATLVTDEINFFDRQLDAIVEAALLPGNSTPEKVRAKQLELEDRIEESYHDFTEEDLDDNPFESEIRRAVKTVEVIGCIIKNRTGSLEKNRLEDLFEEAMNVHLRVLSSFFEVIKNEETQKDIIAFISEELEKADEERGRELNREERKRISRDIFWNLNFFVICGNLNKIVHSLGSNKLVEIIDNVCNRINTPATQLVKHGNLMWYCKNVRPDEIANLISRDNFSKIAKKLMELMVIHHCALHPVSFRDRQKIENKLGIPTKELLVQRYKEAEQEIAASG